jgi:N-acetylated-alpha-linked acidic dipeptidase
MLASAATDSAHGSDEPRPSSGARSGSGTDPAGTSSPLGFTARAGGGQRQAEAHALTIPTPENARRWLRVLTAEPHVAGTPADYKTAVFVRDKLREWGWKADIAEMEVLLNYPDPPSLILQQPMTRGFNLDEAAIATDQDSANSKAFGAFNGYGASGDVSGQVVYANYGRPDDFAALEKMGIEIKGKIVLVRYGELFRGLKVWNAQKRGAKGILIYSDPADDGYAKGDIYPNGRFRPGPAIQRGSVQFLSLGPGDPSTPFGPSVKGAKRLPLSERQLADGVAHQRRMAPHSFPPCLNDEEWEKQTGLKLVDSFAIIPSLPISYNTAHELFKVLAGPNVPAGWQGGLPLAYHVGPGPAEVHLTVSMDYNIRSIWNVIATIPGTIEPDRWVMLGNHRDAWVYGAVDPGSGTAATMEMCRAVGAAVKNGWKPRRTLIYASWDAEEYGLVGSTEWAEEHAKEIQEKAVLMLNVDSAVAGPELSLSGVPSLRDLALEAAGSITDVRTGRSLRALWTEGRRKAWAAASPLVLDDPLWDRDRESTKSEGSAGANSAGSHDFVPQMGWLGSGSDYTAFVDHLGIPTMDAGLKGGYGVYHSIYDSFNWMEKFGDPEFLSHAIAARLYTLIAMRAAAADIVPLTFSPYGHALREHVDELRLIHARKARQAESGSSKSSAEFEGLRDLARAVQEFQDRAEELDRMTAAAARHDGLARDRLAALNDALARVERAWLLEEGLPGRPWFKHAVYAPGLTTGYAAWPLPAVRQAIEDNDPKRGAAATSRAADQIRKAAAALKTAADRAQSLIGAR